MEGSYFLIWLELDGGQQVEARCKCAHTSGP